jgi:hypothetical protein
MVGINHMELLQTQMTELQKQIACLQPQLANFKPSVTTHNNTNTQNNNIHIYLNTHCNNAMTIDEFVESMKFVKDDFNEIDRNRFYYQGATKILKKYFQMLKPEDRPIHCAVPLLNKPTTFFVKSESEWKEECQSMIHYQMKYIEEFENKEEQLAMTRFFERFNENLLHLSPNSQPLGQSQERPGSHRPPVVGSALKVRWPVSRFRCWQGDAMYQRSQRTEKPSRPCSLVMVSLTPL